MAYITLTYIYLRVKHVYIDECVQSTILYMSVNFHFIGDMGKEKLSYKHSCAHISVANQKVDNFNDPQCQLTLTLQLMLKCKAKQKKIDLLNRNAQTHMRGSAVVARIFLYTYTYMCVCVGVYFSILK